MRRKSKKSITIKKNNNRETKFVKMRVSKTNLYKSTNKELKARTRGRSSLLLHVRRDGWMR